jgi:hypothetical protein
MESDEKLTVVQSQLNSIIRRLAEMERRLTQLEKTTKVPGNPSRNPTSDPPKRESRPPINHNYLNRAISSARRAYAQQHR